MRVGLIGVSNGVHEGRFISAFRERGHPCDFISFGELNGSNRNPDIYFGGPLHYGSSYHRNLGSVPYVAVSYAYDILWLAENSGSAKNAVADALAESCGLLVDCEKVKECAEKNYGYSHPILVRPWGLDQTLPPNHPSAKTPDRLSDRCLTVVSARNFTPLHAIPDVIRGFALAIEKGANLRMVMVGDGEQRPEITSLIDSLALGDHIKFLGKVTEQQLQQIFMESDIYVSASVVDGTSISLLQAMNAGLPVVLSDVGGNTEWAGRIEGARLFNPSDAVQLASHLSELAVSRVTMRFDRSDVLAEFCDWKRNADDIVNFCSKLAAV